MVSALRFGVASEHGAGLCLGLPQALTVRNLGAQRVDSYRFTCQGLCPEVHWVHARCFRLSCVRHFTAPFIVGR